MATLTEFLTNIANAIRNKKGTTEPINAQDFATEIESIEVGGGGNEIWTGTTLVSKEDVFIENIYANTQLTIQEVVDMLSKLDYLDVDDVNQTYIAFVGENQVTQIGITRTLYQNEYVYNVMMVVDGDTYTLFLSKDIFEYGWEGFMPLITYPITINTHGYSNIDGLTIGTQNDLLSGLVSSENNFKKVKKENALKQLLDLTKHTKYLFSMFPSTSVDTLISYNDTENVTDMSYMFSGAASLTTIPQLNTSNVTNMSYMFNYCQSLTTIRQLDTSNVTDMSYMFNGCKLLTTIPQLDTSNVTNMSGMFSGCKLLTGSIRLNTSNVTNMSNLFIQCNTLNDVELSSMDKVTNSNSMFQACYSLKKVVIRNMTKVPVLSNQVFNYCYHFTGTVNATYNPEGLKDGRIYVPDEWVSKLKTATIWSVYADCIVPLSTLDE